jgi:hypothetical protein
MPAQDRELPNSVLGWAKFLVVAATVVGSTGLLQAFLESDLTGKLIVISIPAALAAVPVFFMIGVPRVVCIVIAIVVLALGALYFVTSYPLRLKDPMDLTTIGWLLLPTIFLHNRWQQAWFSFAALLCVVGLASVVGIGDLGAVDQQRMIDFGLLIPFPALFLTRVGYVYRTKFNSSMGTVGNAARAFFITIYQICFVSFGFVLFFPLMLLLRFAGGGGGGFTSSARFLMICAVAGAFLWVLFLTLHFAKIVSLSDLTDFLAR